MKIKHILYFLAILLFSQCSTTKQIQTDYSSELLSHREQYKADFLKSDHSPLKKSDLMNLDFFPANQSYKCDCSVEVLKGEKPFDIETYSGDKRQYIRYAIASCEVAGTTQDLALYRSMRMQAMPTYKEHLFLPFMDLTNGESTYGGGRYIDLSMKDIGKDGKLIVDFNKCYNPYCAFSDGYSCPIPPVENHLDIAIIAGEKNFLGSKKKRDLKK